MDSLKSNDLSEWKRFIELWNVDGTRVFEWLEGAEACLQAEFEAKTFRLSWQLK